MPSNIQDTVTDKETIANLKRQLEEKNEQLKKLQEQLDGNWVLLNSRRYRTANAVSDTLHTVLQVRRVKSLVRKSGLEERIRDIRDYVDKVSLVKKAKTHKGIIALTGIPWDYIMRQRPHHIAPRLAAAGYLFIYIDPDAEPGMRRWINDDLLVVGGYDAIEKLSGFKNKLPMYYISIAGFPISFDELKDIKDYGFEIIYEYIDELDESINGSLKKQVEVLKRLEELEPALVISSARKLYDEMAKRFPEEVLLLSQNAVEIEKFQSKKRSKNSAPADLKGIIDQGKPIIGYYGAIASWLDYDLIHKVAAARPDYNFVFIGRDYDNGLQNLNISENIYYLGPKDYEELASYSYWFDAATIPFQNGEIAKSTSPLKLFEYMAMGVPTICTRDLRECDGYDGVMLSKDVEHFITNTDKAIKMKQSKAAREKLMSYAKQNTWDARAKDMIDALNRLEA